MASPGLETPDVVVYEREGEIAVITICNGAVNALSHDVRSRLKSVVSQFEADEDAKVAVIMGAGRMFVGGADIKEFGKPPLPPSLPELVNRVEASGKPVIAAIHGVALGGGLELALGCHFRLAMPGTKLGLPEVTLGLLPGAGGTQRTPRLIGTANAIDFILSGTPIGEGQALEQGLVDRIGETDVRSAGLAFARELLKTGVHVRRVGEMKNPANDPKAFAAARERLKKSARGLAAPGAILDALEAAQDRPLSEGLAEERRLFLSLMETPQRAGLIHAFFLERKVSQLPELEGVATRPLSLVGVVGGGTMGAGIATATLLAGYDVVLVERNEESASNARETIKGYLAAAVKRGKLTEDAATAIVSTNLTSTTDYARLSDVDLAIEAVFESMDVKKDVFKHLDAVLKPGAILATNTSYLDVNEIASATTRPQDVVGLHFFSPAHVMKLLEVVVADSTKPDVVATSFAFGKKLGKVSVRAGVCDGFIGNRILAKVRGAADRLVIAGASPYQVDQAIVDFGFAMGPYAVADLAGLDIGFFTRERKAATRDPRDVVPAWANDLYYLGDLGQKTGKGYYVYAERGRPGSPNPTVDDLVSRHRKSLGIQPREFSNAEIQRRYLAAMVNEAAHVVDEGIAARPLDVDAVLLFGYGFPRHKGGPMHWADGDGLSGLLADIRTWQTDDPYFWQPARLLERLVTRHKSFASLNDKPSR